MCSVTMDEIAMLGKWSNEHMVKSYVNGVLVAAVLARAGHDYLLHLLPRSTIEADEDLLALIFPGVEKCWKIRRRANAFTCTLLQCLQHCNGIVSA